jgi:hypothetical protein
MLIPSPSLSTFFYLETPCIFVKIVIPGDVVADEVYLTRYDFIPTTVTVTVHSSPPVYSAFIFVGVHCAIFASIIGHPLDGIYATTNP